MRDISIHFYDKHCLFFVTFFLSFENFQKKKIENFKTFSKIVLCDFLSLQRIARHNNVLYGCLMIRATPKNYSQSKRTCGKKDMMTFIPPFLRFVALSADHDFRCSRITLWAKKSSPSHIIHQSCPDTRPTHESIISEPNVGFLNQFYDFSKFSNIFEIFENVALF